MIFPLFLKYSNNKSYFKIKSSLEWEELQIIGSKVIFSAFEVKILPDRNFMSDMLTNEGERWLPTSEEEYESVKRRAAI